LQQIDPGLAHAYDLPSGQLVVIVTALLTVLEPGVMIVDQQITTGPDEYFLELSDPREHKYRYFWNVIQGLLNPPPTILNDLLAERSVPLSRCQQKGVIFATGWSSDPATYCEAPFLTIKLWLRDEQSNETYWEFRAEVNRSFRREYERLQQERREATPLGKREGLYGMKIRAGDQISISPKPNDSRERDATGDSQPSRSGRSISATKEIYRSKIQ
jgi:hypothetical protein